MTDKYISFAETVDPQACRTNEQEFDKVSRDPSRTPFQWDDSQNAGFSTAAKTWLPVADNYTINNVQLQSLQRVSHLQVFRALISLRQNPTMKYGEFIIKAFDNVLVYKRQMKKRNNLLRHHQNDAKNPDIFVIILNLSASEAIVRLSCIFKGVLPRYMKVAVSSITSKSPVMG